MHWRQAWQYSTGDCRWRSHGSRAPPESGSGPDQSGGDILDTLSHALWGGGLFGFRGHLWWALFFGAFPDLFSFGLWLPIDMLNGNTALEAPALERIPAWVFFNYDLLHSLVVALAVIGVTAIRCRWLAFTMLAWPFHIIMDIPFHAKEYFPTRFLWPLSNFAFDGIPWTSPWVWYPNLAGICFLYLWRWRRTNRDSHPTPS